MAYIYTCIKIVQEKIWNHWKSKDMNDSIWWRTAFCNFVCLILKVWFLYYLQNMFQSCPLCVLTGLLYIKSASSINQFLHNKYTLEDGQSMKARLLDMWRFFFYNSVFFIFLTFILFCFVLFCIIFQLQTRK